MKRDLPHHPHCRVNGGWRTHDRNGFDCPRCAQLANTTILDRLRADIEDATDAALGYTTTLTRGQVTR